MSKLNLQNLISTNLANGLPITAELLREVENAIVDNIYQNEVLFSGTNASFSHNIFAIKTGKIVVMQGTIENITSTIKNFRINLENNKFRPVGQFMVFGGNSATTRTFSIFNSFNSVAGEWVECLNVPADATLNFSITYISDNNE